MATLAGGTAAEMTCLTTAVAIHPTTVAAEAQIEAIVGAAVAITIKGNTKGARGSTEITVSRVLAATTRARKAQSKPTTSQPQKCKIET